MGFLLLVAGCVFQFININWGHWYHLTSDDNGLLIMSGVLVLYCQNSVLSTATTKITTATENITRKLGVITPLTSAVEIFNKLAQEAARTRGYR